MAFSLIAHTHFGSTDTNGGTTPGIDTTGATLLVIGLSSYVGATRPAISDSKGNTWVARTERIGTFVRETLFYCAPTSVGAGHTFTATRTAGYAGLSVAAFSGASGVFDQENSADDATGVPTTLATGSVTPTQNNELVIALVGNNNVAAGPSSIDSSFTLLETIEGNANGFGHGLAYQIQTTATTRNPTFTLDAAPTEIAATITAFALAAATGSFLIMF